MTQTQLYGVRQVPVLNGDVDHCVFLKSTKRAVFFGTKAECLEWIERNGHDEWN